MEDKDKIAKNNRGRVKAALIRISNFINKDKQLIEIYDLINKFQESESIYVNFGKADADFRLENSETVDFEKKIV